MPRKKNDGDYAIGLKSALDKRMDFHEENVQVQDVFGVASASSDRIQAGSDNTPGDNMVHLLQKGMQVAVDSDEEVFPGDVISTPAPSTNPLAPEIPIACVVLFYFLIYISLLMLLFLPAFFPKPAKSMTSEHRMLGLGQKIITQIFLLFGRRLPDFFSCLIHS